MDDINNVNKLLNNWLHILIDYLPRIVLALLVLLLFYFLSKEMEKEEEIVTRKKSNIPD